MDRALFRCYALQVSDILTFLGELAGCIEYQGVHMVYTASVSSFVTFSCLLLSTLSICHSYPRLIGYVLVALLLVNCACDIVIGLFKC